MAGDPLAPPPCAHTARTLRGHRADLVAAFEGAGPVLDELVAALEQPEALGIAIAAAALGVQRAQGDADLARLAHDFGRLRGAVLARLAGEPAGDSAGALAVHALLDRQIAASSAAFLREREAQVLSMVAHDVSNPLMSVCLIAGYFEDRLGPEHRRSTDTLQRASHQLRQLVRDVQDVADILAGALTIAPSAVDLGEVIADAVAQHETAAHARGVRIVQVQPGGPVPVLGERERLVQALGCILRVALKVSRAEQVVTVHGELGGGEARVRVGDNGPGMSDESRAHAFEPGLPTAARGRKKLNAELFIARSVVEAHGGRIWIERGQPGQGTTVALALPLAEAGPE